MKNYSPMASLIFILSVIASFFIPSDQHILRDSVGVYNIAQWDKQDYNEIRASVDIPAELPTEVNFDMDSVPYDFLIDVTSDTSSGYYSKPQQIKLFSRYKLYYTLDGSLPDKNSSVYDPDTGILIDKNTVLCVRAENDGKFSDVAKASFVIFKDATSYKYAYGYNSLNEKDQYIYERLYDAVVNQEKTFEVGNLGVNLSEISKVAFCVNYDNPMLIAIPNYVGVSRGSKDDVRAINLKYGYTKRETDSYKMLCDSKIQDIFAQADGSQSLMEYLDEVHFSILSNAEYYDDDSSMDIYEALGVLVKGRGVCESYARAFEYVCQKMGLDNLIVVGDAGEPHMWNMIKIDGEWYHIDLTWDDGDGNDIYYDYFNVDDETILEDGLRVISPLPGKNDVEKVGTIYNYYFIPPAVSTRYNYINYFYNFDTFD